MNTLALLLVLIPAAAALAAFLARSDRLRRGLLVAAAALHAALVGKAWAGGGDPAAAPEAWLGIGSTEIGFLALTSLLFLVASVSAAGYLAREAGRERVDDEGEFWIENTREAVFTGCLLLFLATMTLVIVSRHVGLMWVAVEATTLSSAPLIYFHRQPRSLEATWRYLLVCSVGIALALLGNFFLAGALPRAGERAPMTFDALAANAAHLNPAWLKAAFILILVGYGTKMGLAPLHTWLPDAHSEAPSVVSALLSGALLNCALLAILRTHAICVGGGLGDFSGGLLTLFGLLSMGIAAAFIVRQTDYKRLLAYSSVEHMGVISLGWGVGGVAAYGAGLHMVNHSLTKAMLFLLAGNLLAAWRTKRIAEVGGAARALPATCALWLAGLAALVGLPPFGLFVSEITILLGLIAKARHVEAALYLTFLAIVFVAIVRVALRMALGAPSARAKPAGAAKEARWEIGLPMFLGVAVLVLGLWIPAEIERVLRAMTFVLGGAR